MVHALREPAAQVLRRKILEAHRLEQAAPVPEEPRGPARGVQQQGIPVVHVGALPDLLHELEE